MQIKGTKEREVLQVGSRDPRDVEEGVEEAEDILVDARKAFWTDFGSLKYLDYFRSFSG